MRALTRDGQFISIYGQPMARGDSPEASAQAFVARNSGALYGVRPVDLHEGVAYADGAFIKGLQFDHDRARYTLTLLRYSQYLGNVPVFRSELKLLVRNDERFPLVLANSSLHDLGGFRVEHAGVDGPQALGSALGWARDLMPGVDTRIIDGPELVIFAGVNTDVDVPRLGVRFVAERGVFPDMTTYAK